MTCLLLLAGCTATTTTDQTAPQWREHRSQLQSLTQWSASGKLALRTPEQSESASMQWQQDDTNTRLLLSGPVGLSATIIDSDGQWLTVRQSDDIRVLDISTPNAILDSTGWDLPLQALPYWLKGLPSPHSQAQTLQLDEAGTRVMGLQQDGWFLSYENYDWYSGVLLPGRLDITRDSTRLRIIIRQWQIDTAP